MRKDINTGGKYLTAINGKFSNGVYRNYSNSCTLSQLPENEGRK
jgi:hypothetical protein